MAKLAIVNAPMGFSAIWSFMRPWLAKETADKVEILGSNYKSVLLSLVDAENLPESLGGTCTCEGMGGCRMSNAGPWMDRRKERRERWLKGEGPLLDDEPEGPHTQGRRPSSGSSSSSSSSSDDSSVSVKTAQSNLTGQDQEQGRGQENSPPSESTSESSLPSTPPAEEHAGTTTGKISQQESVRLVKESQAP